MFINKKSKQNEPHRRSNNNALYSDYDIWKSTFSNDTISKSKFSIIIYNHNNSIDSIESASIYKSIIPISICNSLSDINKVLMTSTSKYTLFLDNDCIIETNILETFSYILNLNNNIDVLYCDEDIYLTDSKEHTSPFFKPDFSPDTLMSFPYLGKVFLFRTSLVHEIGLFDSSLGNEAYYDFLLKCFDNNKTFFHCPEILFSQIRKSIDDIAYYTPNENHRICQENSLLRRNLFASLHTNEFGVYTVNYKWNDSPLASIIIPSKDNYKVISRCIKSILEHTSYDNFEIIVVDNGSSSEMKAKYQELSNTYGFKYIYEPIDFNFSYMCNLGAKNAHGDYYIFLNDDTEIIQNTWLSKLVSQARLPYSGAIGANLLFGDHNTIQHCGIINNIGPTHAFWGFNNNENHYFGRNKYTYNYIGVTAACLCIEKNKFYEVNGFNENLSVCYNDVDLCYKLIEKGYYNTTRNDVNIIHYESISRGSDYANEATKNRFKRESDLLNQLHPHFCNYDPFYNVNLTSTKVDFSLHEYNDPQIDFIDLTNISTSSSNYKIDSITIDNQINIRGWIINQLDLTESNCELYLILKSEDNIIRISTHRQIRNDVKSVYGLDVSDVGFICNFNKNILKDHTTYTIGFNIVNEITNSNLITWSNEKINL